MPAPSMPEARNLHHEAQVLIEQAAVQQAESSASRIRQQGSARDDGVGVLARQTYQGGTRGSRLCGEDRDRETENSKVCARTRDTRFIQVRAAKVVNPTSYLEDQVWRPALVVGLRSG
jgi:hypothetical protein